jgi:2-methylcitrate dehydratase PrpD
MSGLSLALASFVAETPASGIPARVRASAVDTVVDSYATLMAGFSEPTARTIRAGLLPGSGPGRSVVMGEPGRLVDPASAALFNASAAHALDYDSISFAVSGFVGSAALCALAALADERPYDGADVVTAYCLGWEAAAALARALVPEHYAIGWHPTATMSGYAAAFAACRLLGLDAERTLAAMSVVTSETSGIKIMIGNMLNGYHVGKAARNGLNAALLARAGFVGHADPLEHVQGLLPLYSGPSGARPDRAIAGLGQHWDLVEPGPVFKVHACCGLVHSGLDAVIGLCEEHDIVPDEITGVEVLVHEYVPRVMQIEEPTTGYAAKFCIPYCIAAGLRDRRAGLAPFEDVDPELVELGRRVTVGVHPSLTGGDTFFEKEFTDVRIETTQGCYERRVQRLANRGSGALDRPALFAKFEECVARSNPRALGPAEDFDRLLATDTAEGWTLWRM